MRCGRSNLVVSASLPAPVTTKYHEAGSFGDEVQLSKHV